MTNLYRMRTRISGLPGGPGVSTMYFLDVDTAQDSVNAFWAALCPAIPVGIGFSTEAVGDIINDATGEITGAWAKTAELGVNASGGSTYAAPAGVVVSWETGTILDGKRVRGRTFVVPLASGSYQDNGTIGETTKPTILSAATGLQVAQSASMVVWHRPRKVRPAVGKLKLLPAHDGSHALVTSVKVPDRVAILTSRRS